MRTTLLAALIASTCLWPALTQAQTSSGGGMRGASPGTRGSSGATFRPGPPRSPGRPSNSARPIVPLAPPSAPPIGPYASPSALDRGDIFRAGPRTYAPQYSRSRGFFYGGYGYGGGYGSVPTDTSPIHLATSASRIPRRRQSIAICATVRIKKAICVSRSNPTSAQVFVDGLYAGTVSEFRRSGGRTLDAGPHRIEFRAEGYDSQSVELRIRANDVLSYRGTLTRRDERPELRAAAGPPKTFYVIPRCYAGTSRPRADQLPAGCNVKDVREVPPVIAPTARPTPAARSVR